MFLSSLLLACAVSVPAQSQVKAQPSSVERLIMQLGSDRFAEREAASRKLEEIGELALEALQKVSRSRDPRYADGPLNSSAASQNSFACELWQT